MQRRETDAASQLEAGADQVPSDDSSKPHATETTMAVANLPVTAPLWYQVHVLSTPNVPMYVIELLHCSLMRRSLKHCQSDHERSLHTQPFEHLLAQVCTDRCVC